MDIEKTIEFLLEQEAKAEATLAKRAAPRPKLQFARTPTDRHLEPLTRDITRLPRLGVASLL
jgi:hypothetical protein